MEFETFVSLASDALSGGETHQESENQLRLFMESYVLDYLIYSLQMITQLQNQREILIGASLLYRCVKVASGVDGVCEVFSEFSMHFLNQVTDILLNKNFMKNVKDLVAGALAVIGVQTYESSGSTVIQEFIMKISEVQELETYVLIMVSDMLLGGQSTYGFPTDFLFKLVTKDLVYEESIVPRAYLLFSISDITKDEEFFVNMLNCLIESIPSQYLPQILSAIDGFSEKNAIMFRGILPKMVQYLCQIALNTDCDFRSIPVFIFGSLARAEPSMCQNEEVFLSPVVFTLLNIISEVQDNWEEQEIISSAKESLKIIFSKCCISKFPNAIVKYQEMAKLNGYQWQQLFALLIGCSLLRIDFTGFLFDNLYRQIIIGFSQLHPKIKYAACKTFLNIVSNYLSTQEFLYKNIFLTLCNFPDETIKEVRLIEAKTFYETLNKINSPYINGIWDTTYNKVMELLERASEDTHVYLFHALKKLFSSWDEDVEKLTKYAINQLTFIKASYNSTNNPFLKIAIIDLFDEIYNSNITNIIDVDENFKNEIIQLSLFFFRELVEMEKQYINEELDNSRLNALSSLLAFVGNKDLETLNTIFITAVNILLEELPITILTTYEDTSLYPSSVYERLATLDKSQKVFVQKSKIDKRNRQLILIESIIRCLKKAIRANFEIIMKICNKFVYSQYISVNLFMKSIDILIRLEEIFTDEPDVTYELIKNLFLYFIQLFKYGDSFDNFIYIFIIFGIIFGRAKITIKLAIKHKFLDETIITNFFTGFLSFINYLISSIKKKNDSNQMFGADEFVDGSYIDNTTENILTGCKIIKKMVSNYSFLIPLFVNDIPAMINELLSEKITCTIGFGFIPINLYVLSDKLDSNLQIFQEYILFLFNFGKNLEDIEISEKAFNTLCEIFLLNLNLPMNYITAIFQIFESLLSNSIIADENDYMEVYDAVFSAYTVFLDKNIYPLNNKFKEMAIEFYYSLFPVWQHGVYTKYVYLFLTKLIKSKDPSIYNQDYFDIAIDRICCCYQNFPPDYDHKNDKLLNELVLAFQTVYTDDSFKDYFQSYFSNMMMEKCEYDAFLKYYQNHIEEESN